MTTYFGDDGNVQIGASAIGEVRSWSLEESADAVEDTAMDGTGQRTYKAGKTSWSGSITAWWDEDDVGQLAMTSGAEGTVDLFPRGNVSGAEHMTGTIVVTGITSSGEHDGIIERSFTFQGSGALSKPTVP